jgi:hypothetical protein
VGKVISKRATLAALAAIATSGPAHANVTISSATTQNMNCSAGVCVPTATDAVLNANALETMIASGNVKVTTTGPGVQANNIHAKTTLSWQNANTLALDAYQFDHERDSQRSGRQFPLNTRLGRLECSSGRHRFTVHELVFRRTSTV